MSLMLLLTSECLMKFHAFVGVSIGRVKTFSFYYALCISHSSASHLISGVCVWPQFRSIRAVEIYAMFSYVLCPVIPVQ